MKTIKLDMQDIHIGSLMLVNEEHPVRAQDITRFLNPLPLDTFNKNILLEAKTAALLSQLLKTIDSRSRIIPVSGYRTFEEQEKIRSESILNKGHAFTQKYVARPGHSEHQTGLAVDLAESSEDIDYLCPRFPYTGICGEFRKKAAVCGFIERYGKDKEAITGIAHEPWHFRFVGYPHSKIMQDNNLCLEEYIAIIKEFSFGTRHLRIRDDPRFVEVFYMRAESGGTHIELGDNDHYIISGNNVDGFIATVWRNAR